MLVHIAGIRPGAWLRPGAWPRLSLWQPSPWQPAWRLCALPWSRGCDVGVGGNGLCGRTSLHSECSAHSVFDRTGYFVVCELTALGAVHVYYDIHLDVHGRATGGVGGDCLCAGGEYGSQAEQCHQTSFHCIFHYSGEIGCCLSFLFFEETLFFKEPSFLFFEETSFFLLRRPRFFLLRNPRSLFVENLCPRRSSAGAEYLYINKVSS